MNLNNNRFKFAVKLLSSTLIVAVSTWFYFKTLEGLVSFASEKSAWVLVVPTQNSLVGGESLMPAYTALPVATPFEPPQSFVPLTTVTEDGVNVVITAHAEVTEENGATVSLTAQEGPCPAGATPGNDGLKIMEVLADGATLQATLTRQVCLSAMADSVRGRGPDRAGTWQLDGTPVLTSLESRVATLGYLDPTGLPRTLNMSAVGYCASAEGECSATLKLEKSYPDLPVVLPLNIGQEGLVQLILEDEVTLD